MSAIFHSGTGVLMLLSPAINECESENICFLHVSTHIGNIEEMLIYEKYSDIYIVYASNELVKNLKSQFGERTDSLEIEGISPMWQIRK